MDTQNNDPYASEKNFNTTETSAHNNVLMGILAYLGPLVIIPYLMAKDDPFVKFHVKQGLVLVIIDVILWVLTSMILWQLWALIQLVHFALLVLTIIGIVNVIQKKEKMLPVVGGFAKHFKF